MNYFQSFVLFSALLIVHGLSYQIKDPLILTHLLENGQIKEARKLSRVKLTHVRSYSGFFTINKDYNSNIFFWFFPSMNDPKNDPLVLWLQGGPGVTSLAGLFTENGPIFVNKWGNLKKRTTTWSSNHSMLYIDNPVGTGFSFTENKHGFARNSDESANGVYEALVQFFKLFPMYKTNNFFVTGESYAGKFGSHVAYKIHMENQLKRKNMRMNLKGIAIGNAYFGIIRNVTYKEVYYSFGLLDKREKGAVKKKEKLVQTQIKKKKYRKAYKFDSYVDDYLINTTGYIDPYNVLITKDPKSFLYYQSYVRRPKVRNSIHAGPGKFNDTNDTVYDLFVIDFVKSSLPTLVNLLNAKENYNVLLYDGLLDLLVGPFYTQKVIKDLNWKWKDCFLNAKKKIWRVKNNVAGYIKSFKNLSYLVIRNAGHLVPHDQPDAALDMISRFTSGRPFADEDVTKNSCNK